MGSEWRGKGFEREAGERQRPSSRRTASGQAPYRTCRCEWPRALDDAISNSNDANCEVSSRTSHRERPGIMKKKSTRITLQGRRRGSKRTVYRPRSFSDERYDEVGNTTWDLVVSSVIVMCPCHGGRYACLSTKETLLPKEIRRRTRLRLARIAEVDSIRIN